MNKTLINILKSREDLSEYLFHFTSGTNASKTLENIVNENAIIDVKSKGVICFTEAPLTNLPEMFKIFERFPNPMYAPYGIAVRKIYLFDKGARPVIYGTVDEKNDLGDKLKWRFVEYKPDVKDYTWLREWRLKEKYLELDSKNFFIITKLESELYDHMFNPEDILDVEFDGCIADGGYSGTATGITTRRFKGVSLEDLQKLQKLNKDEIEKILNIQNFSDTWGVNLGGFTL